MIRRLAGALAAMLAVGLWMAPNALAAPADIHSSGPLTDIWIGDDLSCEVVHAGETVGDFFSGPTNGPASCGTFLSLANAAGAKTEYGNGRAGDTPFTSVTPPKLSGSGTPQNPFVITTIVNADNTGVSVTEKDSYVVGQESYRTDITVTNNSRTAFSGKVYHAGDCFLDGSDTDFGAVSGASVACAANANNSPPGSFMQFAPLTGGSHYVEGRFGTVYSDVGSQNDLPNTCDCTIKEDNGMGINWDFTALAPGGGSVTSSMNSNFPDAPAQVATGAATVTSPTRAVLNGSANPVDRPTTGRWIFGLDRGERGPGWSGNVYDQSTLSVAVGSDASTHSVSFPVSNLMPNSVYHVKFVASNGNGTTVGPDRVFTTPRARVSAIPPVGMENFKPIGTVFVLLHGQFVRLTQTLQLPSGTVVDALQGGLSLVANSGGSGKASDARARKPKKPKTFTGTFSGAVFKVIQTRRGPNRGLTTIALVDNTPAFPGARSYATTCKARRAADGSWQTDISRRVLYTLRSRSRGRWSSRGRYAAGTVGGTVWTTTDRCDGTLISAKVDTVLVRDLVRHIRILLHAGQHYLALAHPPKKKH